VAIEELLSKASEDIQLGFEGLLQERLGRPLENRLLDKAYEDFLDSILQAD
jgi:predicted RNase H-like HicB family nuclease